MADLFEQVEVGTTAGLEVVYSTPRVSLWVRQTAVLPRIARPHHAEIGSKKKIIKSYVSLRKCLGQATRIR